MLDLNKARYEGLTSELPRFDKSLGFVSEKWLEEQRPTTKLVKRGYRATADPQVCGFSFECLPAWIWSFRLSDWSTILITDADELQLRQYHLETWSFVKDKLVIIPTLAVKQCTAVVWFVSGSREFVDQFDGPPAIPVVFWLERCGRRRPPDTLDVTWFSVSHELVGGSTTARGVFGSILLKAVVVPDDIIRRNIAHFLDYKERPQACALPVITPHYTISQRLSVRLLEQPVVYASRFSATGWGQRKLSFSELGQAYDLPPYLGWNPQFSTGLVPIQVFRAVVDSVCGLLCHERQLRGGSRRRVQEDEHQITSRTQPLPIDAVWLPELKKWLPGSWATIPISGRAVKSDHAKVDCYPWHQRISLVLPVTTLASIQGMEVLLLHRWRRNVSRSFFAYLNHTYGRQWVQDLVRVQATSGRKRGRNDEDKRTGVCISGGRVEIKGGVREVSSGVVHELVRDVSCGLAVLSQVMKSTWWDWASGSSLFFWRWNGAAQIWAARDGIRIFVSSPLPRQRRSKPLRMDRVQQVMVAAKLEAMVTRSYLEPGFVSNTLHFFAVPKGDDDIRVVFDGTSSGLNETLWAPNFFLPSARSASMTLSFATWMSDMDFGEMFHNFHMDPRIRPFAGVELGPMAGMMECDTPDGNRQRKPSGVLRWTRLFMGMRPSPYNAVQHYYWGEEFARGDPSDRSNPLGYDRIRLNLPGMASYDPSLPKVMKWRLITETDETSGRVAGDVVTFVDDVRITGFSKENCHAVHRQFASRVQYLGMQDAPRKFRPPSQSHAGAWTGTIFKISETVISKTVSQEKWNKGKIIINDLLMATQGVATGRAIINRKQLEKETGFLNHLAMTFDTITPFLKGFYLTLNSWRDGRDDCDWKVTPKRWKAILFNRAADGGMSEVELDAELSRNEDSTLAPETVTGSPSLKSDVEALSAIFSPEQVPEVCIRSSTVLTIVYGFGDASGTGLGATFTCGSGFNFRIGVWGASEDNESSNWKEFTNIVESLEEEAEAGHLANTEVFMFTDNSTVEACASNGSSTSPKLLKLVVRLHALTSEVGVRINIFHVAGTRMIAQGTDGVSRGYLGHGVMAGEAMVMHIPIHISAVTRSPLDLVPWIQSWSGGPLHTILLDEAGWFQAGHDIEGWSGGIDGFQRPKLSHGPRTFIWAPAPMSAEVAIAELRKARIKRQESAHIFVCPRLCTTQWLKQLYRAADFVFEVPVGFSCWQSCMHEPLLIGLVFPFIRFNPWQLRGTPKMHAVGRELRRVFSESEMDVRNILCKFWTLCIELKNMPEHLVRQLLYLKGSS